ncbi:putative clathrin assembly protein [Cinnamomum micranthum f. kanehirae]|uniref:Putative clathrin assembly protein n=1 Tax=Cinnamomum micranthum f. kanehirae TaxID=337451 RepID=A0A443NX63_9MAGN|nr:putative clathrin assembly protein [Cinnamomum micranthum f. kanehirae]
MLLHRLLVDGDPYFHHELHHSTNPRTATRLLNLSDFRDESHSNSWDESVFIRAYSLYLDQRLQCMLCEIKQSRDYGDGDRRGSSDLNYREFEPYGDTNARPFDPNHRESKFREPNRRSPNSNYRELDSYRDLHSRPSNSNYRELDSNKYLNSRPSNSNYRELESNKYLNSRQPNSNYRDSNSNYRESDSHGDPNSKYRDPNSNYREFYSYRDHNSQPPNPNFRDPNCQSSNTNHGEFDSYESYGNATDSQQRPVTPLREMKTERILGRLQQLQLLLDRMLLCQPTGTAKTTRMVLVALYPVVKESFQLYADICEVLSLLLDRFFDMDYPDCVKAFEAYSRVAKQIDELILFYGWCKDIGVVRWSEYPEVQKVSDMMLQTLEEFVRDHGRGKPDSPKKEEKEIVVVEEEEPVPDPFSIKALPPPENYNEREEETENPAKIEEETEADLLNLKENSMTPEEQTNMLALALFSTDGSSSYSKTEPQVQEGEKLDWELALVESASKLSNQRASLGGELDPLLLNGMYDQGAIKQYNMDAQMSRGSASSIVLSAPGKMPVLALPAPDGVVHAVGRDPFEASLSVPPPAYVQMADVERKQRVMVEEQLMWEQYRRDMQGQVGLGRLSVNGYYGVGPPVATPYGIRPVHRGGPYYYSPY